MPRNKTGNKNILAKRGSNTSALEVLDDDTQRRAKRLFRQQKRLERQTGLSQIVDISSSARSKMVKYSDIKELTPLTDTQFEFFESYKNNDADAYVLFGSAGTGKTLIAMYHALLDVMNPEETRFHNIIIVRSSVQSREIGYLPGTTEEKMEAFEAPYHGLFAELTGKKDAYEKLKNIGKVEFYSSSFLRGTTFNNSIIIVDEFQNMGWVELSTIVSRLGANSKMIFCGDGRQDDLHFKKNDTSGFTDFIEVSRKMPEFRNFRFTSDDIVRSGFVKSWIKTCEQLGLS